MEIDLTQSERGAQRTADAEQIARMQRIISRQLHEIEREQNRPEWFYPAIAVGALLTGMAFMTSAIWVPRHFFSEEIWTAIEQATAT